MRGWKQLVLAVMLVVAPVHASLAQPSPLGKINRELVEAMGWCHPDDASGPIVTALIDYLRQHPDWQVRRRALRAKPTQPTKDAQ